MAALPFPAPGTEYGPCVDEQCGHVDCDCTRKSAACICRICKKPIGYDSPCFDEWYDNGADPKQRRDFFVHGLCLCLEIESKRKGR